MYPGINLHLSISVHSLISDWQRKGDYHLGPHSFDLCLLGCEVLLYVSSPFIISVRDFLSHIPCANNTISSITKVEITACLPCKQLLEQ